MTRTAREDRTTARGVEYFDTSHRYKIDGKWATGVTTALKGIPKDSLVNWAAKTVAAHVLDNLAELPAQVERDGYGPTLRMLTGVPNHQRDTAAIRGTDVHDVAERYVGGEEVEFAAHLAPYVRGYARYVEDWSPESVWDETVVASREHGYAGRLDSIQRIPTLGLCLVDYKTSRGVYGEHALQCAAYRYAEVLVDPVSGEEVPMPHLDRALILHIKPDDYDLIPVTADDETFRKFLVAKQNYLDNVQSRRLDKLLGEPLNAAA
ncbi:hypothetical protein [Amycolatopsis echigonensis]|uniref:PD-(D/E)XK nuclease superfamily protein n=1 Tax=Amycolatopsis echigonensis TaxID=2576905 RepID=A0A8E1W2Y5_9PSEU|nr:hypothetical protein [Amycolatopsis echigonensis]MBB2502926.1 hypothetical protein [Amycolatopsis echigonensis]